MKDIIVLFFPLKTGHLIAVRPGTPKDWAETLRKAFDHTIKGPDFLTEVDEMQVTIDPASARELTSAVGIPAGILPRPCICGLPED